MSKRARVLLLSGASLVLLVLVALLLPVPFIRLAPGPTFNVIGDIEGKPAIAITGTTTYPTSGQFDMTTVLESGGPRGGLTFVGALSSWFNSSDAVIPRELIYPDDVSGDDVSAEQAALFSSSESNATAAAMSYLNEPVTEQAIVSSVTAGAPASGLLEPGDVILAIDGTSVTDPGAVSTLVRSQPVGTTFTFKVQRDGKEQEVKVASAPSPTDPNIPYIGIGVGVIYQPDFSISFNVGNVGGPSAGLMLSVGIVDKLTPGELAAGRVIAGTGTITPEGAVGPIGGIRQKLAGARTSGAELFVMPAAHCKEAAGYIPEGLTVTPVKTLAEAVSAIENWTAGKSVPACPMQP
ncbi:MAG: PDZ domain-containing protein [Actinomycetota bacterium]|nr:PDZ domain-containing protein [Actinomycetota bacterium]MDP2289128.1 PDZ domain-containing protein [Actinomycetota bacterium]